MDLQERLPSILISGGGTGGHISPALALADEIRNRLPAARILFVGAAGRMEMQSVPRAGYKIQALPISGIERKVSFTHMTFPFKLWKSLRRAGQILSGFQPDVAIGTGGYASGPALYMAAKKKVPTIVQEQNAVPGLTNRILARTADYICVAYPHMERYFPRQKIRLTGNPVRRHLFVGGLEKKRAKEVLGFRPDAKLVCSFGGSQGSRTLNRVWKGVIDRLDVQLLWQTGVREYLDLKGLQRQHVKIVDFVPDVSVAYAAADLVVSRAGAMAISELSAAQKAAVLVPLPHAAADHQTKNADALVRSAAAVWVSDERASERLWPKVSSLLADEESLRELERNIAQFARPGATHEIVDLIFTLMR